MHTKPQQTQQVQTNTYSQVTPQNTADTDAYRKWKPQSDPSIPYRFAHAKDDLKSSYDNPLGSYTTPYVKEQALRAGMSDLNQQEGQAYREDQYGQNALELGHLSDVAQLTSPRIVQSGSSGTTTQPGQSLIAPIIGAAAQGAAMGL